MMNSPDKKSLILGSGLIDVCEDIAHSTYLKHWMIQSLEDRWGEFKIRARNLSTEYKNGKETFFRLGHMHSCTQCLIVLNTECYVDDHYIGPAFIERYDDEGELISCLSIKRLCVRKTIGCKMKLEMSSYLNVYYDNYKSMGIVDYRLGESDVDHNFPIQSFLNQWKDETIEDNN